MPRKIQQRGVKYLFDQGMMLNQGNDLGSSFRGMPEAHPKCFHSSQYKRCIIGRNTDAEATESRAKGNDVLLCAHRNRAHQHIGVAGDVFG